MSASSRRSTAAMRCGCFHASPSSRCKRAALEKPLGGLIFQVVGRVIIAAEVSFMPIYAYRCATCGFQKDFLQKLSDPKITVCPECGKETFNKQLTAAGFLLKGSGWYAT